MAGNVYDAVIVGSGPNGLAAGIELAQAGASVHVLEAKSTLGGGLRSAELTLPGFVHDVCSGAHPLGVLSPFFREQSLERYGLEWARPGASAAQPMDDGPSVLLYKSIERTAEQLGSDARTYERMLAPAMGNAFGLLDSLMAPLSLPKTPIRMARFGLPGLLPATTLFNARFKGEQARALLGGCAAHSILPFEAPLTGAVGTLFALMGHMEDWPVARGGSQAIADALVARFEELGGTSETNRPVATLADIPPARVVLFDTSPTQLATIAGPALGNRYVKALGRYRYGPGVFKVDWALSEPIPWRDPRTLEASTVHVGGTLHDMAAAEAAVWKGEHPERPFVMLLQQSQFDETRAPAGKHTGYAYCHVPEGSTVDVTEAIESQVERFAPGFRDTIEARATMNTVDFLAHNSNYHGGAITGGVADWTQFVSRPVLRLDPYATPNPRIFICSASTPPGGGVHGMCGYHAAKRAIARLDKLPANPGPLG